MLNAENWQNSQLLVSPNNSKAEKSKMAQVFDIFPNVEHWSLLQLE